LMKVSRFPSMIAAILEITSNVFIIFTYSLILLCGESN
jgi:hypothetical protein